MPLGLLGKKLGHTRVYDERGNAVAVTIVLAGPNRVLQVKTPGNDGYSAVQLGLGKAKVKNVTQPMRGHFAKAKVEPKRMVTEFRVDEDALLEVGDNRHVATPPRPVDADAVGAGREHRALIVERERLRPYAAQRLLRGFGLRGRCPRRRDTFGRFTGGEN
ncbi:MAG: 50S ribosomal protein L3 [Verrucomicrobiae bacterium]|nr:50S ribosomal protein L3 [Verrucomicrobiae bacterium]